MMISGHRHRGATTCFGLKKSRSEILLDSDEETATNPPDVPEGYLAVYVGKKRKRFIIPTAYLGLPVFRRLLDKAEEEFGFVHHGGLTIPCDEDLFREILCVIDSKSSSQQQNQKPLPSLCSVKPFRPLFKSSLQKSFG
eukprot:TRINITY_DN8787_c0_g1_i1.p1 TRINITY_DN8787_c0_g1~~TRINITY_DN8787_c0_g1_i1.p1  ORF type:complete len:139 (-),score=2.45 TRINITY_DN8787_c0_g1_i1:556-972(-)